MSSITNASKYETFNLSYSTDVANELQQTGNELRKSHESVIDVITAVKKQSLQTSQSASAPKKSVFQILKGFVSKSPYDEPTSP